MTQAGVVVPACGQCWVGRVEADRPGPTVTFPAAVPLAYWLPVVATSWCGTHGYLPSRSTVGVLASGGRYVVVWDPRLPSQPQYRWHTGFLWSLRRGVGPTVTFPAAVPLAYWLLMVAPSRLWTHGYLPSYSTLRVRNGMTR